MLFHKLHRIKMLLVYAVQFTKPFAQAYVEERNDRSANVRGLIPL